MSTTTHSGQESIDAEPPIDPRTARAVTGNMIVVPEDDATGRFEVYSAKNGENHTYVVDLRAETCECGDYEHRKPAGGCKHERRVKLALGIMDVPEALHGEIDEVLANSREKYGADRPRGNSASERVPDPTDRTPVSAGAVAVTDGGQFVETEISGTSGSETEPIAEDIEDTDTGSITDGVAIDHRNVPVEVTVPRFFDLEPDVFHAVCGVMDRDIANAAARDTQIKPARKSLPPIRAHRPSHVH